MGYIIVLKKEVEREIIAKQGSGTWFEERVNQRPGTWFGHWLLIYVAPFRGLCIRLLFYCDEKNYVKGGVLYINIKNNH